MITEIGRCIEDIKQRIGCAKEAFNKRKKLLKRNEVLEAVGEGRRIVETIERRKRNWIGHVVRGDGLLKLALERKTEGKRPRGRQSRIRSGSAKYRRRPSRKRRAATY